MKTQVVKQNPAATDWHVLSVAETTYLPLNLQQGDGCVPRSQSVYLGAVKEGGSGQEFSLNKNNEQTFIRTFTDAKVAEEKSKCTTK